MFTGVLGLGDYMFMGVRALGIQCSGVDGSLWSGGPLSVVVPVELIIVVAAAAAVVIGNALVCLRGSVVGGAFY